MTDKKYTPEELDFAKKLAATRPEANSTVDH